MEPVGKIPAKTREQLAPNFVTHRCGGCRSVFPGSQGLWKDFSIVLVFGCNACAFQNSLCESKARDGFVVPH